MVKRRRAGRAAPTGDETRFFGYRGIIVLVVILGLVVTASLTGLVGKGLCLIDASRCEEAPSSAPSNTAPQEGSLPAPSDELAVYTGAGVGSVTSSALEAIEGPLPEVGYLWHARPAPQASPPDTVETFALAELPCGTLETGPCDAWAELQEDPTLIVNSASRLSAAGLDPFRALDGAAKVLQFTVEASALGLNEVIGVSGDQTAPAVVYQNSRNQKDGSQSTAWGFTATTSQGLQAATVLRANHTKEGEFVSLTVMRVVVDASTDPAQATWTTVELPAAEDTRAALGAWIGEFRASGLALPSQLFEPTSPESVDMGVLVRAAHSSGAVRVQALQVGAETPTLDAAALMSNPAPDGLGMTVVETRVLGAPGPNGHRTFTVEEPEA